MEPNIWKKDFWSNGPILDSMRKAIGLLETETTFSAIIARAMVIYRGTVRNQDLMIEDLKEEILEEIEEEDTGM